MDVGEAAGRASLDVRRWEGGVAVGRRRGWCAAGGQHGGARPGVVGPEALGLLVRVWENPWRRLQCSVFLWPGRVGLPQSSRRGYRQLGTQTRIQEPGEAQQLGLNPPALAAPLPCPAPRDHGWSGAAWGLTLGHVGSRRAPPFMPTAPSRPWAGLGCACQGSWVLSVTVHGDHHTVVSCQRSIHVLLFLNDSYRLLFD